MGWKSRLIKPFARRIQKSLHKHRMNAVEDQRRLFQAHISKASSTKFGQEHSFGSIKNFQDYTKAVPLRDYEGLRTYVDQILAGGQDILWPGQPRYFAKTSGTTSGVKYIPLTTESMPNHMNTARNALFNLCAEINDFSVFDGKMIFLSGSPEMEEKNGIPVGRLSGIVNHFVPGWLRRNQMPSYETNCIEEWGAKLNAIIEETATQDMRLISGIPPWVQMYYEQLIEKTGKADVGSIFKNFSMFVYGGVNYEPYRGALESLVSRKVNTLETYPASEGFIAFQDTAEHQGLLLNTNSGIFFEFVPANEIFNENPTRLMLDQVETGVNYAIIINNNAGLWSYNIGDTIEFLSINPYRLKVTGRIKHFISAFGEHVIGKEIDQTMIEACKVHQCAVVEFTVAPQVSPTDFSLPYHEWFVEFGKKPVDMEAFALTIDKALRHQNVYYDDLIRGQILRPAIIRELPKDTFRNVMKKRGKLGGQNKVPRLSNDRELASEIEAFFRRPNNSATNPVVQRYVCLCKQKKINKIVSLRAMWKKPLFFCLIVLGIVVAGCRSEFETARISNDPPLILETANKFYEDGEYLKAKELYTLILTTFRGTAQAENMYFTYAYCHYHLGDLVSAAYYFNSFGNTYPNSQFREEASFMQAYSNYLLSPPYRLTQEATLEAIDDFQQFVNRYPNSSRVDECNGYIDELRRKLEVKAYSEGEQYFELSNYQSALQVFENVLQDYPDTEDAEKIRYLIVKSAFLLAANSVYERQQERYELTQEKYDIFKKKFPSSSYDEELKELIRKSEIELKKFKDV